MPASARQVRDYPRDTDLTGAFYKRRSMMTAGGVSHNWISKGTFYRELRRLGFAFVRNRAQRERQTAPDGLDYLQPPGPTSVNTSNRPKPDLCDMDSKHKYFLVLDGMNDDEIERGAQSALGKCAELNARCNTAKQRVVAFWVVSRVQRVAALRQGPGVVPDMRRCPEISKVLRFKQPRRSSCMATSPDSPLNNLNVSSGKVVEAYSGNPHAVACAFVRFDILGQ